MDGTLQKKTETFVNEEFVNQALTFLRNIAGEFPAIPDNAYKSIAYRAAQHDAHADEVLIRAELQKICDIYQKKRDYAKRQGFAPFTSMGKFAYDWIKKNCGEWVLPKMAIGLKDPEDIHPEWAIQCAKTMSMLGRETCEEPENLYIFVTNHPEWQNQKLTRERFKREWDNARRNWDRQNRVKIQIIKNKNTPTNQE
jgi:hypothetical protein